MVHADDCVDCATLFLRSTNAIFVPLQSIFAALQAQHTERVIRINHIVTKYYHNMQQNEGVMPLNIHRLAGTREHVWIMQFFKLMDAELNFESSYKLCNHQCTVPHFASLGAKSMQFFGNLKEQVILLAPREDTQHKPVRENSAANR